MSDITLWGKAKLLGLFSGIGGPLYFFDLLQPHIGIKAACALIVAPVVLMAWGFISTDQAPPKLARSPGARFLRASVWAGLAAAVVLTVMNCVTAASLLAGAHHPNRTLIVIGIVVGTAWSVALVRASRRFLACDHRTLPVAIARFESARDDR